MPTQLEIVLPYSTVVSTIQLKQTYYLLSNIIKGSVEVKNSQIFKISFFAFLNSSNVYV